MSARSSSYAFPPMPPDDHFQRAPSSARAASMSATLMERDSFSMEIINSELEKLLTSRNRPGDNRDNGSRSFLMELPLTPSVYVLYAGITEAPSEDDDAVCDWLCGGFRAAPEGRDCKDWVTKVLQRQDSWLSLGTEMYKMTKNAIERFKRSSNQSHFGVTLQAAVPGMPLLSFPFVLHHLESSSEQRTTGERQLHMLRTKLAFFDFFTASKRSAGVAVAPRSMTLTVDSNFQHVSDLELCMHFGVKHASLIQETYVMQMLRPSRTDMPINDVLNEIVGRKTQLHKQLINLNKVLFPKEHVLPDDRIENIFIAAAVCLWARDYKPPEPIVQKLTTLLDYADIDLLSASIHEGVFKGRPDAAKFEFFGMELYECAVQRTLALITSTSARSQGSAPSASKRKTFTIVEVPFCSPVGLQAPGTSPTVSYPATPGNFSLSASVNEAIRVKMAHLVTAWRCREHLHWDEQPCASLDADAEEYLRSIFDQCDLETAGCLNKRLLLSMVMNNPEVSEFFKIPEGSNVELFFEELTEQEGLEATTWDEFKEFYVSNCLDDISARSGEKAQWTRLMGKVFGDATAICETTTMGTTSPVGSGLDRWMRVLKRSKEDTFREEKEYANSISVHNHHWADLAAGSHNELWRQYCNQRATMQHCQHPDEDPEEVTTLAFDNMIEMLAKCDDILFLKIAYGTRHASQPAGPGTTVPLPAQLAALDLPVIVQVWEKLFPIKVSLRQASVQQLHSARLQEFQDFVHPPGSSVVCMSKEADRILKQFLSHRPNPHNLPAPPPVFPGPTAADQRQDLATSVENDQVDDARQRLTNQTTILNRPRSAFEAPTGLPVPILPLGGKNGQPAPTPDPSQNTGGSRRGSSAAAALAAHMQPVSSCVSTSTPGPSRPSGIPWPAREQPQVCDEQESPFIMPHSRPPPERLLTTQPDPLDTMRPAQSPAPSVRSSESEELPAAPLRVVNGHSRHDIKENQRSPSFAFASPQFQAQGPVGGMPRNTELPSLLTTARGQFQNAKTWTLPQVGHLCSSFDDEKVIENPDVQEFLLNHMRRKSSEQTLDKDGMLWAEASACETPRNLFGVLDPWGGCQVAKLREIDGSLRHYQDGFPEEDLSKAIEDSEIQHLSASKYPNLLQKSAEAKGDLKVCICKHVHPRSMVQGHVGDCWLVAAVAALCEFENPIFDVFAKCKSQEGATGPYELILHDPKRDFRRIPTLINDEIPCFRQRIGWRPCFASTLSMDENSVDVWPMLLEKGIAMLLGGYLKLNGNRAPLAWAIITGERHFHTFFPWNQGDDTWGEGEFTDLMNKPSQYTYKPKGPENMLQPDRIWGALRLLDIDGKLMSCTFNPRQGGRRDDELGEADAGDGLLAGHAYSLITVKELRGTHKLLQLRNPWADAHEWSGPWSDKSREWLTYPEIAKDLDYEQNDRRADGLFWMSWDDFKLRVADIVYSEASFTQKYGGRVIAAPAPVVDTLWSKEVASEVLSAGLPASLPDLWHNLQDCDPDVLQEDLRSYCDGFSDQDLPVKLKIFRSSEIRWVSASRVHKLLQYECEAIPGEMTEEEQLMQQRWADIAAKSGASDVEDAKLCSRIDLHVMQAHSGNSWLVAAITALARYHKPIFDIFLPKSLHKGKDGPYQLSLHDPNQGWRKRNIKINDRVPCYAHYGNNRKRAAGWRPCYSTAFYREVWPMLLEKGIAYLLGGYDKLDGNSPQLAWAILTGDLRYTIYFPWANDAEGWWGEGSCELATRTQQYKYQPKETNHHAADWAWDKIKHGAKDGKLMACTFQGSDQATPDLDFVEAGYKEGLAASHSYVILIADSFLEESSSTIRGRRGRGGPGRTADSSVEHRLLCLKSPWAGDIGWCGRWSFDSVEWEQHPKVAAQLHRSQQEYDCIQDGVFWMDWAQFQENVQEVVMSEKAYWRTLPPPPVPKAERAEVPSRVEQLLPNQEEERATPVHQPNFPKHTYDESANVDQLHKEIQFQDDFQPQRGLQTGECTPVLIRSPSDEQKFRSTRSQLGNHTPSRSPRDQQQFRNMQPGEQTPIRSPCRQGCCRPLRPQPDDSARAGPVHQPNVEMPAGFAHVGSADDEQQKRGDLGRSIPQIDARNLQHWQAMGSHDEHEIPEIDPRPDVQPEGAQPQSYNVRTARDDFITGPYSDNPLRNVACPGSVGMTYSPSCPPSNFGNLSHQWPSNFQGLSPPPMAQNYSATFDALRRGANPADAHAPQPRPPDFPQTDMGFPVADLPAKHYPVNAPILYYSKFETGGPRWIQATVLHYSPFTGLYTLNCKDDVDPSQLRPVDNIGDPMAPPPPPAFASDPMASPPPAFSPLGEAPPASLRPISFTCKYCHQMLALDATSCSGCGHPVDLRPREFAPSPAHFSPPPHTFTPAQMAPTPAFLPEAPNFHRHVLPEAPLQHTHLPAPQRPPVAHTPPPPVTMPSQSESLSGSQPVPQQDVQQGRNLESPRGRDVSRQDHANGSGSVPDLFQTGLESQRRREQELRDQAVSRSHAGPSQRLGSARGSRSGEDWSDRSSHTSEASGVPSPPPPPAASRRRASTQETRVRSQSQALQRLSTTEHADPEELRENLRELDSDGESERSELYDGNGTSSSGTSDQRRNRTVRGTHQRHQSNTRRAQEHSERNARRFIFRIGMRVERIVHAHYSGRFLEAGATGTVFEIAPGGRHNQVRVEWDASGSEGKFRTYTDTAKIRPIVDTDTHQVIFNGTVVHQPDYERSERLDDSDYEIIRGAPSGSGGTRQAVNARGAGTGGSGTGAGTSTQADSKAECTLFGHIDVLDQNNFMMRGIDRFKSSCQKALADKISEVIQIHADRIRIREVKNFHSRFRRKTESLRATYNEAALQTHGKTIYFEVPGTMLQSHDGPCALPIRELRQIQRALFQIIIGNPNNSAVQVPEFFRNVSLLGMPSIGTSLFTKTVDPFMGTSLSGTAALSHINVYRFCTLPGDPRRHPELLRLECQALESQLIRERPLEGLRVAFRSSTKVTRDRAAGHHYKLEAEVSRPANLRLDQVKQYMCQIEELNTWRIEAAIHHEGTHLNYNDSSEIQVCAHVDIRGDMPVLGVNGGSGFGGWQQKFEAALRRLATHRRVQGTLDIDVYDLYLLDSKPAENKNGDARGTKKERDRALQKSRQPVWHVDFMVSIKHEATDVWDRRVDVRAVQDLLWALNRKETKDWGKQLPESGSADLPGPPEDDVFAQEFFANYTLDSGVRICANELNTGSQLTPHGTHCTFVAEIDIVDCKNFFENSGPLAFASLLSDALHIIAGISAPRITILDAKKKRTDQLPNHDKAKRYAVHVEVGFLESNPGKMEMQRIYDYMWHLHSEIIRNRWAHLPFFKHYIVEGGVQVYYPSNVRSVVQAIEPQKSTPKLRAHIDVIDNVGPGMVPFLQKQNGSMQVLAQAFCAMLKTTLDISEECIKVTCIRRRPVHIGRADVVRPLNQQVFHEHEMRQFNDNSGCGARIFTGEQIRQNLARIQDIARRHPLLEVQEANRNWWGYTFDFEVMAPSTATNPQARACELDKLEEKLRKLHSGAIWRRHNGNTLTNQVEFLKNFIFDVGVQIDFAYHPLPEQYSKHVEDYMYPDEAGPVIVYPNFNNIGDPYYLKEKLLLIRAHVDIVYKGEGDQIFVDDACIDGPYSEEDIRNWFDTALREHLSGFIIPEAGFRVIGVQKKAAHRHKLAKHYLEGGFHRVDRAKLQSTQGYTINFELRCDRDFSPDATWIHNILVKLRSWTAVSAEENTVNDFFTSFEFDRGVMVDDSEQQGLATFSMSPLAIRTSMTFTKRGGANHKQLQDIFPNGMAAALGTCANQIQRVRVREGGDSSTAIVDFEVNTLTPNPAKQEFESLMQKLRALTLQCSIPGRWWMELFPNWKPVSVVPGQQVATSFEEDEIADREVCEPDEEHLYATEDAWQQTQLNIDAAIDNTQIDNLRPD